LLKSVHIARYSAINALLAFKHPGFPISTAQPLSTLWRSQAKVCKENALCIKYQEPWYRPELDIRQAPILLCQSKQLPSRGSADAEPIDCHMVTSVDMAI